MNDLMDLRDIRVDELVDKLMGLRIDQLLN